jgi:hypothetical protein
MRKVLTVSVALLLASWILATPTAAADPVRCYAATEVFPDEVRT